MPPRRKSFPPTEPPVIAVAKKLLAQQTEQVEKRLADMAGYLTGALEQLMLQQGQMMTVQAGVIQYLNEQLAPGCEAQIKSIVEMNIARMKAEREAREQALNEEVAKRAEAAKEAVTVQVITDPEAVADLAGAGSGVERIELLPPMEAPADIAPEAPADAPADSQGST